MITVRVCEYNPNPAGWYFEFAAKSTDEKPTGEYNGLAICNGSCLTEMDTGAIYMYDADSADWIKFGGEG